MSLAEALKLNDIGFVFVEEEVSSNQDTIETKQLDNLLLFKSYLTICGLLRQCNVGLVVQTDGTPVIICRRVSYLQAGLPS